MKTGIIVYVLGNQSPDKDFDEREAVKNLNVKADRVEFVFSGQNSFDMSDAWLKLIQKGMNHVVCKYGEIEGTSVIRLKERELQLCAC